jgi:hypothetical protein
MTIQEAYNTICQAAPVSARCSIDVSLSWRNGISLPQAEYTAAVHVAGRESIIEVNDPSLTGVVDRVVSQLMPQAAPMKRISEDVEKLTAQAEGK